jgi:hypothetical protein
LNGYATIAFADSMPALWHICVRDNPQMTVQNLFEQMDKFPQILELFIWNDNQAGVLKVPKTGTGNVDISASGNSYTYADFGGSLQFASMNGAINLRNNQLSRINIDGCSQITGLDLTNNALIAVSVQYILETLDALGRQNGEVHLAGTGNAVPPPAPAAAIASLISKGWTVEVNH